MKKVYLSLGSNLGDRQANLRRAIELLAPTLSNIRQSSIYETEPVDVRNQPRFLNLALEATTGLFPLQLLKRLQDIEREMGRVRIADKGPRIIDIDMLLYGNFVIDTPKLTVPHPRMTERRFVLDPMAELVPDLRHPVLRRTMRELLAAVAAQKSRKISPDFPL